MVTGREDLLQAFIEAFLMEKGSMEFYSQASSRMSDPEAKEIFKELSEWEEKHMDFIQFLYQSILDNKEIKSFEVFRAGTEAPVAEAGIPVKDLEQKIEEHDFRDEKKALALATALEGKACNFYRKLSQNAEDTNAQVVFKEMMKQEIKHLQYLKKLGH